MYKVGDVVEVVDDKIFSIEVKVGDIATIINCNKKRTEEIYTIYFPHLNMYQESLNKYIKLYYYNKASKCMEIE